MSFNSIAIPLNISRLYHRTYEEFMMAPISACSVVLGEAAAGCLRGLFGAVVVLGLSFAFGARLNLVPLFWLILLLNSFLFSCLGIFAAMLINSHEDMNAFSSFVIVPMAFLSNTFFSTRDLPAAVNLIINVLPLTHTSKALRALALQQPFPWESLLLLAFFAALFFWLAVRVSLRGE
ncbi:MAG: ABC transporter permease [Bacillota bacterium]